MKKLPVLCFLFAMVVVGCQNHNNTKSPYSDDPEYRSVEEYLVKEYGCDSIMEYYQGDSIFTTLYNDCSEYVRLSKKKSELEKEARDEQISANHYSSYSEKDEYLHHKHSSNAEYIRRKIYDIEEELDKVTDNFKSEYKGKSVYVRFRQTIVSPYTNDTYVDTIFCEVHLSPYSGVIEKDKIMPLREYGKPYRDEQTGKYGLKEVHTKKIIVPAKYDLLYEETYYIGTLSVVAKNGGKFGLISDEGKLILKCEFDSIFATSDDLIVIKKDGKMGVINKSNQWVIPNEYDAILRSYHPSYYYLKKGGTTKGYLNIDSLKRRVYKADGVWGAYDIEQKELSMPVKYSLKETMKKTSNYDHYQIP